MKILMLSWEYPPHVVGGLAIHVQGLARALTDAGHDVTVLTQDAPTPAVYNDDGVRVIRVGPVPVRAPDFMGYVHQLNQLLLAKALELVRLGERFDIVHAHDWIVAFAASGLKQALRLPMVATIHATEFGRNAGLHNDTQRHISDIEWWLIYEAWRVIVCSEAMRTEVKHVFQAPSDKVEVIPNGIDVTDMQVKYDEALRRQYAHPHEELVIFVGRLVFEKGVDTILYALRHIRVVRPNVKLIVAGQGALQDDLARLARDLGVADAVHFVGHVDAQRRDALYGISDVATFPSRYEPFGIVALEAMAAGIPVIVGDTGGLKEIITDGVDGFRVLPGNPGALAAALLTLLDDGPRAERMARRAREKVEKVYTWQSIAQRTLGVFEQVISDYESSEWAQAVSAIQQDKTGDDAAQAAYSEAAYADNARRTPKSSVAEASTE